MIKRKRINDCQQSVMTNLKLCTETSSKFKFYTIISESKLRYEVIKEIVHPLKTYSINRSIHNFKAKLQVYMMLLEFEKLYSIEFHPKLYR